MYNCRLFEYSTVRTLVLDLAVDLSRCFLLSNSIIPSCYVNKLYFAPRKNDTIKYRIGPIPWLAVLRGGTFKCWRVETGQKVTKVHTTQYNAVKFVSISTMLLNKCKDFNKTTK